MSYPDWISSAQLGRWASLAAVSGGEAMLPVVAPFDGEVFGHLRRGSEGDVAAAVTRARLARPAWSARPAEKRAGLLLRVHDELLARQEEVLDVVQLETGKARRHAFEEVADAANVLRYYGVRAGGWLAPRRRRGAVPLLTRTITDIAPVGVVGVIVPWNYPLNLAITDVTPALVSGNAVVMVPDQQTSFTALWAASRFWDAGVPRDVLQVVTGVGAELGPALIDQADAVLFTGSTATGRRVATQAGGRLIPASLELGGKNPLLVLADADVEAAAGGIVRGCFVGAGQVCVSYERLYVDRAIHDALLPLLLAKTRALKVGCGFDFDIEVGSLGGSKQLARVQSHVDDAVAKGATVLAGGRTRPDLGPFVFEPTLLAGVTPAMTLWAEETFGPVAAIYPVDSDDDAVRRANDTPYGLTASVWSQSAGHARAIARRLDVGSVNINEAYAAAWGSVDSPGGGWKQSGPGHRHGREAFEAVTRTKTIAAQRLFALSIPPGMPPAKYQRLVTTLLRWMRRTPGLR